jgi:hypothetical protein
MPVEVSQLLQTIAYTYEWKDVHVDLSHDAFLHCLVVQVRNVGRVYRDILLGIAVLRVVSSHSGGSDTFFSGGNRKD